MTQLKAGIGLDSGSAPGAETIAAIASPAGGAARGIVRVSGADTAQILARCFTSEDGRSLAEVSQAQVWSGNLSLGAGGRKLPVDVYFWPDARSYTREPVAEIHTIGSPPLLAAALATVCAAGARLAEPGEFTLRAFLAGRLDLTQAEAVLGVIDATGQSDLDAALAQLAGGLARPMQGLRDALLDLLAQLEAGLDFVEEDIEFITVEELTRQLSSATKTVSAVADQMSRRSETKSAARVVLVGYPNVGKSSLFNALAPGQSALVSEVPGATRDYLIARLELDGAQCELVDTAGVESSGQWSVVGGQGPGAGGQWPVVGGQSGSAAPSYGERPAEAGRFWRGEEYAADPAKQAQYLAAQQREAAQVTLLCLDATRPLNEWEREQLATPAENRIVVRTKCDDALAGANFAETQTNLSGFVVRTSAHAGVGLTELRAKLRELLVDGSEGQGAVVASTAARCGESLRLAGESLVRALELAANRGGEELVAAEIRVALAELGKVVGAVYTDDILDRIFSRFCIGK